LRQGPGDVFADRNAFLPLVVQQLLQAPRQRLRQFLPRPDGRLTQKVGDGRPERGSDLGEDRERGIRLFPVLKLPEIPFRKPCRFCESGQREAPQLTKAGDPLADLGRIWLRWFLPGRVRDTGVSL
jgi:hypothetical protein